MNVVYGLSYMCTKEIQQTASPHKITGDLYHSIFQQNTAAYERK